jgi:NAD(P)-dependent dehydrogenase (short-subunit alcohol dehydrogenase family)
MLASGGSIVNIAAVDLDEAYPGRSTVAATVGGLVGLSRAVAVEWAPSRLRVNVVVPGIVLEPADLEAVDRGERSLDRVLLRAPGHRLWTASDVARTVLFLSGSRSEFITGQVLYADGGWNTWTQHPEGMRFP